MQDKLKKIPQQILEFCKKLTTKQKTLIIAIFSAVVVAIILFAFMFTRTTYEQIAVYEDASDTAAAKTILEEKGIKNEVAEDGVTLSVDSKRVADAKMALGENSIGADSKSAYTYDKAFDNSISTTSKEKEEKMKIAIQNDLANTITETINGVEKATVQVTFADDSTSILEDEKVNTCAAVLTINEDFKKSNTKGIAQFLATSIGSVNTDNIKIIDQDGNILFSGANNENGTASMSDVTEYSDKVKNDIKTQVQALLLMTSNYNEVEVAPNIEINFDKKTIEDLLYYTENGEPTGPKASDYTYNNENNSNSGSVVGTDANDGEATDYDVTDGGDSSGTTTIYKNVYNTSQRTTLTEANAATIDYDNSSVSVVLNRYRSYYEDDLKDQLEENEQTFSEFKTANGEAKVLDVDPALLTSVSKATGIAEDNISITAYEVPLFYESEQLSTGEMLKNYLQYILALIIIILLVIVVIKGMKPVEVEEMEPELSVEALLATTKENQSLDDIEFSDKSAAREQIEKFVDENPEAVAQLLRNWLNEDWE